MSDLKKNNALAIFFWAPLALLMYLLSYATLRYTNVLVHQTKYYQERIHDIGHGSIYDATGMLPAVDSNDTKILKIVFSPLIYLEIKFYTRNDNY